MKQNKNHVFAIIALVAMLVSFSSLLILSVLLKNQADEQSERLYHKEAEANAQVMATWFESNSAIIETMASNIITHRIFDLDYKGFHRYLSWNRENLNTDGHIRDIYFTNTRNVMVFASNYTSDGSIDHTTESAWYMDAVDSGKICFTAPYVNETIHIPVITVSKAVYLEGELQGVLCMDVFINQIEETMTKMVEDGYAFMIDHNQSVIFCTDEEIEASDFHFDNKLIKNLKKNVVYELDETGTEIGYTLSEIENSGWYFGMARDRADILQTEKLRVMALVSIFLFAVACVLYTVYFISTGSNMATTE